VLPQDITIHENNRLRSLTVYFGFRSRPVLDSMKTILLQISSPHIQVITIVVWRKGGIHDDDDESDLDEIISRPMFAGLKSVTFQGVEERYGGCGWLTQKLPLCAARGILNFYL
jgi:hypothetical protein